MWHATMMSLAVAASWGPTAPRANEVVPFDHWTYDAFQWVVEAGVIPRWPDRQRHDDRRPMTWTEFAVPVAYLILAPPPKPGGNMDKPFFRVPAETGLTWLTREFWPELQDACAQMQPPTDVRQLLAGLPDDHWFHAAAQRLLAEAATAATPPTMVRGWSFARHVQGWMGVNTTPLEVKDGALTFGVTGKDVQLISPLFDLKPEVGDVLRIRLKSTTKGTAEWFWRPDTTGQYGGFRPELHRLVPIEASADWQTIRVQPFWQELPKIVGIRFDPPEGLPGEYAVASIEILRYPQGEPVPASFDFSTGDHGWITPEGAEESTPDGLHVHLPTIGARCVSPPLVLDASASPYLVLDMTGPDDPGFAGRFPCAIGFQTAETTEPVSHAFWIAAGTRGIYNVRMAGDPAWKGQVSVLTIQITDGAPADLVLHSVRAAAEPAGEGPEAPATGLEFQTEPWRDGFRLPVALPRIDVAKEAPPETHAVESDYTVAMWYFAAWEPEYTWDGWKQVAERAPWRIPLLYDSSDPEMQYNGIQFYRASSPRVVDWHVHWMREHAVNLMLWDWYPRTNEDGSFDPTFFGNRALEIGFLGKEQLGDPPVKTNRFVGKMDFAVMWTNHAPHNKLCDGIAAYIVDQFFSQPNYHRMDGKPLLTLWSVNDLVSQAGGEQQAKEALDRLRERARAQGMPGVYVAAVNGATKEILQHLGIDGVTGYHYSGSDGFRIERRRVGDRVVEDRIEDYPTQTIPGNVKVWAQLADTYGRDYLLATTPMQNWEPTLRAAGPVIVRETPDAYREMLRRAKAFIAERGLRRFVNIEAWNEWLEGSYMEPSTQWGLSYLEAVRDTLGRAEGAAEQ